jgi:hypothetical protein
MHLNPESLSFALLISDLGSIARAANILGMKQATLSRKLTALESRVGVRLFDRSTRGAVPTVSRTADFVACSPISTPVSATGTAAPRMTHKPRT